VAFARSLAALWNCENISEGAELCGQCRNCRLITQGHSPVFIVLAASAEQNKGEGSRLSIGIEQIRELKNTLKYGAEPGYNYKVVVIDQADDLTEAAQNSFLKLLEEPTGGIVFILVNENPHRLRGTIISRCVPVNFNDLSDFGNRSFEKILNDNFGIVVPKSLNQAIKFLEDLISQTQQQKAWPLVQLLEVSYQLGRYGGHSEARSFWGAIFKTFLLIGRDKMKWLYCGGQLEQGDLLRRQLMVVAQSLADLGAGANIGLTLDFLVLKLGNYVQ
jgi:hypothetical protein